MTVDLSAFYFDIRKDALYCDPISSVTRTACLTVLDHLFRATVTWLAPMLRSPPRRRGCRATRPRTARCICNCSRKCRRHGATTRSPRNGARSAPCAASSPARWRSSAPASASAPRSKPIRSCTCPIPTCSRRWSTSISPRSASPRPPRWSSDEGPADAFRLPDVHGVAVVVKLAEGTQVRALLEDLARGRQRSASIRTSRRATRRRCANGIRMRKPGGGVSGASCSGARSPASGWQRRRPPAVLDQALKLWLLFVFDLQNRGVVSLTPFLDLVLIWNRGISYGLFQQEGPFGQWALLALNAVGGRAAVDLAGAVHVAADGAVARPDHRRARSAMPSTGWPTARWPISCFCTSQPRSFSFNWYVFNLADVAIVAGVAGLLYEFIGWPARRKTALIRRDNTGLRGQGMPLQGA